MPFGVAGMYPPEEAPTGAKPKELTMNWEQERETIRKWLEAGYDLRVLAQTPVDVTMMQKSFAKKDDPEMYLWIWPDGRVEKSGSDMKRHPAEPTKE